MSYTSFKQAILLLAASEWLLNDGADAQATNEASEHAETADKLCAGS